MIPETAFTPAISRQSFLETVGAADALLRLEAGLGAREPFLVLAGEPGAGKTTLVHEAIARWESRVAAAVLAYPALTGAELLEEIVLRFGGQPADGASRPKLMACLERSLGEVTAQGKVAMVVVDDAHRLTPGLLEELRLLVNAAQQAGRPLEVLLAGLPEMETLLDDPALVALRQRVSVRARLAALPAGETRRYVRHRVDAAGGDGASLFPRKTCNEIATLSQGLPRRINALAAESLRLARAAGESAVQPEHVRAAAASLWGALPAPPADERDDADDHEPAAAAPPPRAASATRRAAEEPLRVAAPSSSSSPPDVVAPPRERVAPAAPRAEAPPARRSEPAGAPLGDADVAPRPVPASHDPKEWVHRFVGDQGPIRIGSQAGAHFAPLREPFEPVGDGAASSRAGSPPLPNAPAHTHGHSRRRRGGALRVATYATLATCAVIAAVVLFARTRGATPGSLARTAAAVADSQSAPAKPARAPRRATRTASSASAVTVVRPAATPEVASAAPVASAAVPVSPTGRWTLQVASASDLQSAFDERDRAEELAGIEGWVVPAPEGSSAPHRVVLGIYRSHARASAAAKMLLSSRTLPSVSIVPLPKRDARR